MLNNLFKMFKRIQSEVIIKEEMMMQKYNKEFPKPKFKLNQFILNKGSMNTILKGSNRSNMSIIQNRNNMLPKILFEDHQIISEMGVEI